MYHAVNNYYESFYTKAENAYADGKGKCSEWAHDLSGWTAQTTTNAINTCVRVASPSINFCIKAGQLVGRECTSAAMLTYCFIRDNWTQLFAIALAWVVIVVGLGILNGYNFSAISLPMAIGMGCGFGLGVLSGVMTVKLWPTKHPKRSVDSSSSDEDCDSVSSRDSSDADEVEAAPLPVPEDKRSAANLTLLWLDKLGVVTQTFVISVAISIAIAAIPHFPLAMGVLFGGLLGNYLAAKAGYGKPLDGELREILKLRGRVENLEENEVELDKRSRLVDDLLGQSQQLHQRLEEEKEAIKIGRLKQTADVDSVGNRVRSRNETPSFQIS